MSTRRLLAAGRDNRDSTVSQEAHGSPTGAARGPPRAGAFRPRDGRGALSGVSRARARDARPDPERRLRKWPSAGVARDGPGPVARGGTRVARSCLRTTAPGLGGRGVLRGARLSAGARRPRRRGLGIVAGAGAALADWFAAQCRGSAAGARAGRRRPPRGPD